MIWLVRSQFNRWHYVRIQHPVRNYSITMNYNIIARHQYYYITHPFVSRVDTFTLRLLLEGIKLYLINNFDRFQTTHFIVILKITIIHTSVFNSYFNNTWQNSFFIISRLTDFYLDLYYTKKNSSLFLSNYHPSAA